MMHINPVYWSITKDFIQMSCLSLCCYYWLRWLAADTQKKLHCYFYLYCSVWAVAFVCDLSVIMQLLELSAPWLLMLFISVHQKTLQKNLIGLYKITPAQQMQSNWLEELVRFCLQAEHDLHIIVEHQHALDELLTIEMPLNAPITHQLMHYLINSTDFEPTQHILISSDGRIRGLNVCWNKTVVFTQIEADIIEKNGYHLSETDGIFLRYAAQTRRFDIILQQKTYTGLTASQTIQSIHNYLLIAQTEQKDMPYASDQKDMQQPHA